MVHASKPILADLGKLNPDHRAEIKRIATSDTRGSSTPVTPAGARPVSASRKVTRPDPSAPPIGTTNPRADWPTTRSTFASGLARPRVRGSLPSREGPPR